MLAKINLLIAVLQFMLLYTMFRTPRTCWHGWKMSQWFKANLDTLDRHANIQMGIMWKICKTAACTMGGMILTFFMNIAFAYYIRYLISINTEVVDPTLIAIFALTNAGCIVYAIQAHSDDGLITKTWTHYDKRHNAPWPPKII